MNVWTKVSTLSSDWLQMCWNLAPDVVFIFLPQHPRVRRDEAVLHFLLGYNLKGNYRPVASFREISNHVVGLMKRSELGNLPPASVGPDVGVSEPCASGARLLLIDLNRYSVCGGSSNTVMHCLVHSKTCVTDKNTEINTTKATKQNM